MEPDYQKLGFMCGIEIHQQLEGKKLFCNCPTTIRDDKPDIIIKRELRAVAGETGEVDQAAKHEMAKAKHFIYHAYTDTTCLVELDEEPPHLMNKEALDTAVKVALLLNAKLVDEVQIMRKTVVDGSNTTGFQRTSLIARNGYIETSEGRIRIPTICLEEEAAQVKERTKEYDVYNLSRLGIPLIEIATEPDIKSPKGAKEAAQKIGMILRSVDGVKRGLGTIRQDVNISIKGGARTEIKGFQDVQYIVKVIEGEVARQQDLVKKGKKIEEGVRKANKDGTTEYLRPMPGAARMYPETDTIPIRIDASKVELPELISDKAEKIKKLGLGQDLSNALSKAGKADILVEFVEKFKNVKPAFIAETMLSTPKTIRRKDNIEVEPSDADFEKLFAELDAGKISKDSVYAILLNYGKTNKLDFSKYELMSDAELKKEIEKIVAANKGAPFKALIGQAMAKLKGKADGKKISEMLKSYS